MATSLLERLVSNDDAWRELCCCDPMTIADDNHCEKVLVLAIAIAHYFVNDYYYYYNNFVTVQEELRLSIQQDIAILQP